MHVAQADLDDLADPLTRTRWPHEVPGARWSCGWHSQPQSRTGVAPAMPSCRWDEEVDCLTQQDLDRWGVLLYVAARKPRRRGPGHHDRWSATASR